jgi:energy-coupling factor transport system permease protein
MSDHTLQYIDNQSWMARMDSLSKLIWVVLVVVITFQLQNNLLRAVMLLSLIGVALVLARIPPATIVRASPLIFGVALLLGLFHLFIAPGVAVYHLGPLSFSKLGIQEGLEFFLRLATMVFASFMLIWTTDIRDLMTGLVHIGMPYRYAYSIFMALRFLPMIQQEVDAVRSAHAIRGRASASHLEHRIRLWQRYLFTVIVNGLRKAENTAVAIETRGFGAYPKRTFVKEFHWSLSGIFLVVLFLIFGISMLLWQRS